MDTTAWLLSPGFPLLLGLPGGACAFFVVGLGLPGLPEAGLLEGLRPAFLFVKWVCLRQSPHSGDVQPRISRRTRGSWMEKELASVAQEGSCSYE